MKFRNSFSQLRVLTGAALAVIALSIARAVVPTAPPTFSNPLNITNSYSPFQPAGVKVFQGNNGRKKSVVVHHYLTETRLFDWSGTNVETHILREMNFENGQLSLLTDHYFAQADNGALYTFGKTVNHFTNGNVLNHIGSWLVGSPESFDPPETLMVTQPSLVMLSVPETGNTFQREEPPSQSTVTARVTRANATIGTGLGRFTNVVRIVERTARPSPTTVTYARDVGLITKRAGRENLRLIASTLTGTDLIIPTNNISAATNELADTNAVNVPRPVPIRPIVTPTFPEVPATPVTPGTPLDPTVPVTPETPADPENPLNPGTPIDPGTPPDPGAPINPGTNAPPGTNFPPFPPLPN